MSLPINLNVGVLSVNLTLGVGQLDDITQGATGSRSMSFLELSGNINGPLGARLASLDLGLLPLSASSTAPQGGVDCGGLDPPAITAPESGAQTGETPTITGTGQPGATVTVTDGDTELGTATVGEDGNWLLTPENPLPPGEHTIEAVQSSGDEVSEPSDPVTFTVVDTQAPDPPSITGPEDGSTIGNDTPEITGTGEPGATVTVTDGDTELGTATVGEDGTWSLTPEEPLQDGEHTIVATQEDAAGNVSDPSSEVSFTVDTQAPDPPTIESPADGSTIGNDTPVVEGTGEPGATVDVSVDGESVGEATVDGDGNWSLPLDEPLSDGDHVIEAVQTDPAGNSSEPAESTVTVDATPPEAPTITAPENGSTVEPTTTITGEGEPGNEVTVSVDGEEVGTVTVGENGTWTLELDEPLAPGDHTASAVQTDDRGRDSPESNEVSFTVAADAIAAPEITAPESGSSTQDTTPVIEGTGDPGATVDVIVDGELIGQSTVDESGNWRFEPTTPLAPGDHTITATQTVDGQTSPESDAVIVTIEPAEAAPDAPVVTNPQDGGEVDDRTPVVEGSGETGATVDVVVDGEPAGSAAVDADGSWSLDAPELACGEHTLSATQTDNAGATSDPTEVSFTVVCAGDGGPGDGGPGDGGPGDVPGGGPGGGDGSDGGQDLITAPPVPSGPPAGIGDTGPGVGQDGSGYADPGQDGAGYGDAGYGDAGQDGLAQTGAPLTVVAWLGLLALVAGGALLRRFRADR